MDGNLFPCALQGNQFQELVGIQRVSVGKVQAPNGKSAFAGDEQISWIYQAG